jgi:hypothetical protein
MEKMEVLRNLLVNIVAKARIGRKKNWNGEKNAKLLDKN